MLFCYRSDLNHMKTICSIIAGLAGLFFTITPALANVPGGGTNGANVTLTDNGSTVTMANGIVSILCTKSGASLSQINYTYNNGSGTQTQQLLAGGTDGGEMYWENSSDEGLAFTYSLIVNPASNGGNYAEIAMTTTTVSNDVLEVHFSILRGSTGFYTTAIWYHRAIDGAFGMGECRDNIYAGSIFNWMSVDANRNRLMEVSGGSAIGVQGAPVEVSLWTNGIYAGRYEDKYKYSADFGDQRVWGWSSVGAGGSNVGLWNIIPSAEYYNGGPMKRELMSHIGTTILNMLNGGHYGGGEDGNWAAGEVWTKVSGPYLIYCNNITNTITATNVAAQALYNDALAQATAEVAAWPYSWFTNANYTLAAGRGAVSGKMVINDAYNPNASASNLWVGVIQQPVTTTATYDFQEWMKPYQFWVHADANGNFTIPNVIAGNNYTLYAFGPGAAGTYQSQVQSGGSAPNTLDIPASPFSVTVTAGATNNLGAVTWTPTRVGPTVFEIGYPDRTGRKFRHGEDWWIGDIGPGATNPLPIWSKWLEYQFDFPNGPDYVVGQSRWTTDWNFIQPVVTDSQGNYNSSSSTITFNLANANSGTASLYLALSSDYQGPLMIAVNGNNIAGSTGYFPAYNSSANESDASIREGIHGIFSDLRTNFSGSLLVKGQNTITITMRKGGYFANHAMYDYVRLEQAGYIPPPPASVVAYAGNSSNLICWPVQPGATGYNVLRSTTSGSGYVAITNGVTGPVCGSGWNNATYVDATAANGTGYYYVVQSVNSVGVSINSPQSSAATPSAGLSASAPAAPSSVIINSATHQSVALSWSASSGADYYTIYRSTLFDNGSGVSNVLGTIVLNNATEGTSYTDNSPTDGSIYSYSVTAANAAGISSNSVAALAVPLPAPPASAPGSSSGNFSSTNVVLNWSAVSGAVGYIISRSSSANGPFTLLQSITETTYTDVGLNTNSAYYYQIRAVNAAGVSANAIATVLGTPVAPGLTAIAGSTQVSLTWSAVTGATNYVLQSSAVSGGSYSTLLNTTNTGYVNSNLVNGTTYYYVVYSQGPNGTSPLSVQANATPSLSAGGIYWTNTVTASAQSWNVNANWINAAAFPNATQAVAVVNSAIAAGQTINLNQAITVGSLSLGASGGVFTVAANGGTLTFDNTPLPATLTELSTGKGDTISAPIIVDQNLLVSSAGVNALTLSGNISGSNVVISGNTVLSGTNTYTGGTVLNNGTLIFNVGTAIPASGTLTLNNTGAATVVTANSLPNVLVNGTNAITGNGNSGTGIGTLDDEGWLNIYVSTGSKVFDLTGTMTGPGILVLANSSAMTLRFNGTGGDANAIFNLGTAANFASVRNNSTGIALGGLAGGAATTLQGASSYSDTVTYTIGGANADAEFDGVIANGGYSSNPATVVIKTGAGTQMFTGANTYSSGTTINGGTLLINNSTGSGTGSGAVTVANGGTLAGDGSISGAVTVNSGGALSPGNPLGTLTVSNNLTLATGSTTFMQVQPSPFTNDAVKITGTLTESGTLNVSNANATAFAAGNSFKLFSAANYSGSFANFVLPSLTTNLVWNTTRLNMDGSLWVVSTVSPDLNRINSAGTDLVLGGTSGTPGWTYYVQTTTNLTLPAAQWTYLATNEFDAGGNFNFTNAISPLTPAMFYRIQSQ